MTLKMKLSKLIITAFLLIAALYSQAQMPGAGRGMGGQNMNMGHFYGKIVDSVSGKPLDGASIQLIQNKFDSVAKKRKDVIVSGMLTTKRGEFSLENLPIMATYKLKITAIGYKTIERKVNFELNMAGAKNGDFSSMISGVDKDLGNFKMKVDAQQLENVTVTASKPMLTMGIDRKIFNVEKNLTSVGGTAIDVMKNVPSVNVDIDGNVSLRNATPQIFVDGRPSTLTLDQIPADAIASVEIITNPSAKFDASGGGAGILNIVLKKNRKAGYNGNLRASIDMRGRPGFGGDFNVKQGKVNFFAAGMLGMRKSISTVSSTRTDFLGTTNAYLTQTNKPINTGFFAFGRLGMDYFIDNRNTITIGGNIVRGQFKTNDLISIFRDTVNNNTTISDVGSRSSKNTGNFRNYGSTLSFKHNFAKANMEWTADATYNYSKNDNIGDYNTQYFYTNNNPKTPAYIERTQGGGTSQFITAQTDFSDPITAKIKIDAGLRGAWRNFTSFNDNYMQTTPGSFFLIPGLSNNYKFNDVVYAGYVTFAQQLKKFNYQLGLRLESSSYEGNLISRNQRFKTDYPFSLFPSAFATYKLTDKQDLQLNYSRKINRPNFFQLIPFIDYSDSLNLSVGNPNLVPEFTNLLELSYSNQYKGSNTFLATVYMRNTNDLITRYQYKDANPNPAKSDSVIISTYANANQSYTFGLELTGKNKVTKWWDLTTNLNLFNSTIKAGNLVGGVTSSQFSWFAKINNNFKLPKNFSIQLSGDYTAKTLVAPGGGGNRGGMGMMFGGGSQPSSQGYIKPIYGADLAIKYEFLKNNAASLTLQFSDIFRSKLYATHNESVYFVQDNQRRRDPQMLRLNFNWRFGKMDVSLFKRKNMKGEMENMQNAQQGMGN
ncbi:MAG: TonB-dependent receptor [Chitinophagaceae bacterium]|nr:TonB-dependent receptor [Chitinophagaceae bacterium]